MWAYALFALLPWGVSMRQVLDGAEIRRFMGSPAATGLLLAATGLTVWTGISIWGGMSGQDAAFRLREAWDTQAYFYFGMPVMAIAVAIAAYYMPRRIWRWPLWLVTGHQIGVLLVGLGMQSGLSLVILTLMLAILLAVFFSIPALVGSMLARRVTQRAF